MKLSRRAHVAVLCLILVACAVATAAAPTLATGRATLTAIGDEAAASGEATVVQKGWWQTIWGGGPYGTCAVTCTGLTPGCTYQVGVGFSPPEPTIPPSGDANSGVADRRGRLLLNKNLWMSAGLLPGFVAVYRVDPTGGVAVLSGPIVWK